MKANTPCMDTDDRTRFTPCFCSPSISCRSCLSQCLLTQQKSPAMTTRQTNGDRRTEEGRRIADRISLPAAITQCQCGPCMQCRYGPHLGVRIDRHVSQRAVQHHQAHAECTTITVRCRGRELCKLLYTHSLILRGIALEARRFSINRPEHGIQKSKADHDGDGT